MVINILKVDIVMIAQTGESPKPFRIGVWPERGGWGKIAA